jgi:hypothetical protein
VGGEAVVSLVTDEQVRHPPHRALGPEPRRRLSRPA